MLRLSLIAVLAALAGFSPDASANKLLIERVGSEAGMNLPARGMTMSQVERKYGAPMTRMEPRGGQKRQWPTIHRWTYSNFIVYFEKNRVIDAVAIRTGADEVGPKAPIR